MMLDAIAVAGLVAGAVGLLWGAYRCGRRRADLPMMLERASLAVVALASGLVVLDPPVWLPPIVLGPAVVLMLTAGCARRAEDAAHCHVIASEGGPASRSTWAGVPQLTTAMSLPVAGAVSVVSHGTLGTLLPLSAAVLPLVVAVIARPVAEVHQRNATTGYQHELTFWAWELTEDQLIALEVRLENSRLARVLGLAPFLVVDPRMPVEIQCPPGTGSARR